MSLLPGGILLRIFCGLLQNVRTTIARGRWLILHIRCTLDNKVRVFLSGGAHIPPAWIWGIVRRKTVVRPWVHTADLWEQFEAGVSIP